MCPSHENDFCCQDLLDRAAGGETDAYDLLLDRASGRLLRLTRRMLHRYPRLRRWEQTDDVFQNAAMRLHRALQSVRLTSTREFLALATTQIRRTLIDLARHHFGPEGHATHHNSDGGPLYLQPDCRGEPETLEAWARFHEVIGALPVEEHEVFSLVWYGGVPQSEVAEILGVSQRTVVRRLQKARLSISRTMRGERHPTEEE